MNGGLPSLGKVGGAVSHAPELDLWIAVLRQAVSDAVSNPRVAAGPRWNDDRNAHRAHLDKRRAMKWIFMDNPDFQLACELADVDPDFVRTLARRAEGSCDEP